MSSAARTASGKFVLRLPPKLHEALKKLARRRGVSLNALCLQALEPLVGRPVPGSPPPAAEDTELLSLIRGLLGEDLLGVLLFGSVARGEARDGSDIDLLIVVADAVPLTRSLYERWDAGPGSRLDDRCSPHFVHLPAAAAEAGSIWFEAAVDGLPLLDDGGRISRLLARLRGEMAEGRLERRKAYGHPYWVRCDREGLHVQ